LGSNPADVWHSYASPNAFFTKKKCFLAGQLSEKSAALVEAIGKEKKQYKSLDKTTLKTILTGRQAIKDAGWQVGHSMGINIGSSRGATHLFEKHHSTFMKKGMVNPNASPSTTLGNLSTWLAHDLEVDGFHFSHSITCSTALHAILNGIAWLQADMADRFIAGGAESPITPFTLAQMNALKIYAAKASPFPCRSLDFDKSDNTMILGEGAALFCLSPHLEGAKAKIIAVGYGSEKIEHGADISADGQCFQASMSMALKDVGRSGVDAVVMHAPGTVKGDKAELNAIQTVFGQHIPALTSNKWKVGHALGASGGLSLEMALLMLEHNQFIENPFYKNLDIPKHLNTIMVNAVGFGGNAVSIVVTKS